MKYKIKGGTTSKICRIFIRDTSKFGGEGLTGLVYNSSGLTAYYALVGDPSGSQITLVSASAGTFTSGGFVELDATNMPGWYELHIPNTALLYPGASKGVCNIMLKGATNMAPVNIEIELDAIDYETNIPNQIWEAPATNHLTNNTMGSGLNKVAQDVYFADVKFVKDTLNVRDEFGVVWFKNAYVVSSGQITDPRISIYNTNGTQVINNGTMDYASTTLGVLRFNQNSMPALLASGEPYMVAVSGNIDGQRRIWQRIIGLDYLS